MAIPLLILSTALLTNGTEAIAFDAGVHWRLRETYVQNAPGLPGADGPVPVSTATKPNNHGIRWDLYPWAAASWRNYTFKVGFAHIFTETFEGNPNSWHERSMRMPGLVTLNNLYLDGQGLADGFVDFRIGRQDLMEHRQSVFGLDWILWDGTPGDSSETYFADMARTRLHFTESSKLDVFAMFNSGENELSFGRECDRHRGLNRLLSSDSNEMDQWGGGLVWHSDFAKDFPYKLYSVFKGDTAYTRGNGERQPGKNLVALGVNLLPHLTDEFWLDLDVAKQLGRKTNGAAAGGLMASTDLCCRRQHGCWGLGTPYGRTGLRYMSGDKHRLDADDSDTGWDPMWRRTSAPSEVFNNGLHPALRYWTNMLWYNTLLGIEFGRMHRVEAYSGPVFADVKDGLGGGDGTYKGLLSRLNYYLPFLLADKSKGERIEIYSAFCIELFNPGDYFESRKPATYIRWMINVVF